MSIANDKTRTSIVIDKTDKEILEKLAKADDRSFNYIVNRAIKQYIKSQDPRNR